MPVEETYFRMLRNREFDIAEMPLSSYAISLFSEQKPFIAIQGLSKQLLQPEQLFAPETMESFPI